MLNEPTRAFLERQRLAHLATADASGAPHVVPVCFVVLGKHLYIAIDEKPKRGDPLRLRRVRNIVENPRVALVVDVYHDQDWSRLGFVLLHATARILQPTEADAASVASEHAAAVRALRQKYPQYRAMALEQLPVIAADVESVTTWGRLEP
jgi:PPOX class probable F420-dependent enzyme